MDKELQRQDGESIEEWVKRLVRQFAVVVFSKTHCPFCTQAKTTLASDGKSVPSFDGAKVLELDKMKEGSSIQQELLKLTGIRTVPNVFIQGKNVGGNDKVTNLHARGELLPMMQAATKAMTTV